MLIRTFVFCALIASLSLTASVNAQILYALDSSRALSSLDMTTGAKTALCTVSTNAGTTGGLAYDRANNIMYLTSTSLDSLFTLNLTTCQATLIGAYGDSTLVMHGLEYDDSTGKLYGGSTGSLFEINKTTGLATLVGSTGLATGSFINLGYQSNTDVMYATHTGTDSLYTINRLNGAVSLIGPMTGTSNPHGLAYNWQDDVMFLIDSSTDNLYKLDLTTGAANLVGSTGTGNLLGLAYVPEPATMSLLLLALPLLRRRR